MKPPLRYITNLKFNYLAGIYIHIPFCKQACYYCNFHFSTSTGSGREMIDSMKKEIEIRGSKAIPHPDNATAVYPAEKEIIKTIYFGGGTPSLLRKEDIDSILLSVRQNYPIAKMAEVTLEANPDDIRIQKLIDWKNAGINRLSIGVQSFIDRDLKWMNRAHHAEQALHCILLVARAGFTNFSIDLIFGTPGLTDQEWKQNVQTAIDLGVPHLSAYALTVEPKTALQKMIEIRKKENVSHEGQANQFMILMEMMQAAGYEHYEISNFARPGFRSRHNSSYWQNEKYIGIGPSAHSYNGVERSWNIANNQAYIRSLQQNILPAESETLNPSQRLNEYIMTSLRTIEGLDLDFVENAFSPGEKARIAKQLEKRIDKDDYFQQKSKIVLTQKGKLFADRIAVELFV